MCGGVRSFSASLSSSGLFSGKGGGNKGIVCAPAYLSSDSTIATITNSKKTRANSFNEKEVLRLYTNVLYYNLAHRFLQNSPISDIRQMICYIVTEWEFQLYK